MNLTAIFLPVFKQVSLFYVVISLITSCHEGSKKNNSDTNSKSKPKKEFSVASPAIDEVLSVSDSVAFSLSSQSEIVPDSVKIYLEGNIVHTEKTSGNKFTITQVFSKVGRQNFRIIVFYNDSLSQTLTTRVTILSDTEPASLTFRLIRKIPHSSDDFIQGLVYHDKWLYQGTGRQGFSSLKKINPENGVTELERKMEKTFFGEGITIVNQKIYQLTYRQKVGFVYDVGTFELIREFDLQTMEGWGLTTDGKNLIVSDGSSVLYFYNPYYFNQIGQLDVCHNRGLVINLNELEYVDGAIWANVYGESYIVKIDAETGVVLARLELESLFPADLPRDYDHVLNGIAYNSGSHTFYITGKLWPLMYEIEIQETQ